jgi:hypothetical protein
MSLKDRVIEVFNMYPSLINGFTVKDVAKRGGLKEYEARMIIQRFKRQGKLEIVKASQGRGRGKGKTYALYRFKRQGKAWLKAKGNKYVII